MSKTLEQAVHEMDLPRPGAEGEDFSSYVSRVAHAAAFVGAAWAIANGPQVQAAPRAPEHHHTHPVEQDEPEGDAPDWMSDAEVERERPVRHQDVPEHIVKER